MESGKKEFPLTTTSYAQLKGCLTQILANNISSRPGNSEESGSENLSPHGAFWKQLSYHDLVNGHVPNMGIPILTKSNSTTSNLILGLGRQAPF
jgi:hypothetical protein